MARDDHVDYCCVLPTITKMQVPIDPRESTAVWLHSAALPETRNTNNTVTDYLGELSSWKSREKNEVMAREV
jgi:hypothetical protein